MRKKVVIEKTSKLRDINKKKGIMIIISLF